jgi:hypothetical protein
MGEYSRIGLTRFDGIYSTVNRRPHLHASEVDTFLTTGLRIAPHTDRSE